MQTTVSCFSGTIFTKTDAIVSSLFILIPTYASHHLQYIHPRMCLHVVSHLRARAITLLSPQKQETSGAGAQLPFPLVLAQELN